MSDLELSESRWGRVRLHLICMRKDRRYLWHLRGILRELFLSGGPHPPYPKPPASAA